MRRVELGSGPLYIDGVCIGEVIDAAAVIDELDVRAGPESRLTFELKYEADTEVLMNRPSRARMLTAGAMAILSGAGFAASGPNMGELVAPPGVRKWRGKRGWKSRARRRRAECTRRGVRYRSGRR